MALSYFSKKFNIIKQLESEMHRPEMVLGPAIV